MSDVSETVTQKNSKISILSIVIVVLGIFLCVGAKFIFTACEVGEDMIMSCHWAEQVVAALGVVIALEGLAAVILKDRAVIGCSISVFITSVLTVLIPNTIISLCKMTDMHCQQMLRPFAIVMGIIIAIVAAVNVVVSIKKIGEKN